MKEASGMLLHIRPRIYAPSRNVDLVSLDIHSLGLHLRGGVDLVTRRPYPNKGFSVACRKKGHKAIDGILIETLGGVTRFDCVAVWAVDSSELITHYVHYEILDADFAAASDHMALWHACHRELGGWQDRWPSAWPRSVIPLNAEPLMEVYPELPQRYGAEDLIDEDSGLILMRRQSFRMPTLERERLLESQIVERMPILQDAFTQTTSCVGLVPARPCRTFIGHHAMPIPERKL